jgi:predicted nucleotidyltransferase component of viral defense system
MIDENNLLSFSHYFSDTRQLEKDYLINLMLKVISINKISDELVFKGGTALYLFYGLDRFSEDLDFTYTGKTPIAKVVDSYLNPIIEDFSLNYVIRKKKGNIIIRDENGKITGVRTELFIEGPLFGRTGVGHKIKIDISARNDIIMKPKAEKLASKYSDIGTMLVYVMDVEEMLIEKFCALSERAKARDLYDIYFLLKYKNVKYDEKILVKKLYKRGETFNKKILIKSIDKINAGLWNEELSYLVRNLPGLAGVKSFVKHSI